MGQSTINIKGEKELVNYIPSEKMENGDVGLVITMGHQFDKLILRAYNGWVLLNNPNYTWQYAPGLSVRLVNIDITIKGYVNG